ncbi:hypothetical protein ACFQE8_01390 [Salinirubellus sp. GCM10025818]|uniref:DUF7319 domain-containing protein n=1 Tax=Salinirubellus TaxID=2162630 RepID=UPI0030D4D539
MSDSSDEQAHAREEPEGSAEREPTEGADAQELTTEELRAQVEEKYDFENFGPAQMAEMSAQEWDAAFDLDTWITGSELLDRLEADVKHRVLTRDVFARVERIEDPDRLVAYSDEGYAVVYPDGSVEGSGTVLRDVKPLIALCSMEEYDPPEMPEGDLLPDPMEVPEGSGEFGNLMVQIIAGAQVLAGLGLFGAFLLLDGGPVVLVAGLGFLFIGITLFVAVANARLSDRFRAEEYRNRLRAIGFESDERPEWLPPEVEFEPDGELEETPDGETA